MRSTETPIARATEKRPRLMSKRGRRDCGLQDKLLGGGDRGGSDSVFLGDLVDHLEMFADDLFALFDGAFARFLLVVALCKRHSSAD